MARIYVYIPFPPHLPSPLFKSGMPFPRVLVFGVALLGSRKERIVCVRPKDERCVSWAERCLLRSSGLPKRGRSPTGRKSGRNAVSRCYLKLRSSLFGRVGALIRKGWGVGERQTALDRARADSQSVSQSVSQSLPRSTWSTLTLWSSSSFERGGISAYFCLLCRDRTSR